MALLITMIDTTYPCCVGAARFRAINEVPRERYQRRCPRCGQRWDVRRTLKRAAGGMRMDHLDWERV